MKREITCVTCAAEWLDMAANPTPEAVANNEKVTVVGVLFTVDWTCSTGACDEHAEAERIGLPLFYSLQGLRVWLESFAAEVPA